MSVDPVTEAIVEQSLWHSRIKTLSQLEERALNGETITYQTLRALRQASERRLAELEAR